MNIIYKPQKHISIELYREKAMVACTKPQQRWEKKAKAKRRERDRIKFIALLDLKDGNS